MTAYLIRRFGTSIVILIGISIFTFGLLHAVFPSPARAVLGPKASLLAIEEWNRSHGFSGTVFAQYWHYVDGVLHGNLGYSYKANQTVAALFRERWARSLYLTGVSTVLAVLIAVPLGIYQAVKRNGVGDNVATSLAFTFYAMPDYLLYLIAISVFALTFKIFNYQASQSTSVITVIGDWRSIDVGYLPLTDIKQAGAVKANGYNVFGYPDWGFTYVTYNFLDKTGHFNSVIDQLYFRQALAHLQDEPGYVKAFFGGAGGLAYGPVPAIPKSPYTPANAVKNPYPFSVPTTVKMLKSHGWNVVPGGTDTCAKPGTGAGQCGAGIPAGTKLSFNLIYATSPNYLGEMVTDLASQAAKAGIQIHLQSSNFNYIVNNYDNPIPSGKPNINKWAMEDFGGYTNNTYPTQLSIFSPGVLNEGTFNNPTATRLIHASVSSGNPTAVKAEAAFLTQDQPSLFQPNPDQVVVWKKTLSGTQASLANQTQFWLTPEFWYFTK